MAGEKNIILPSDFPRPLILKLAGFNRQKAGTTHADTWHTHDLWSLDFCDAGRCEVGTDGRSYIFKQGDILLIGPRVEHRFLYTGNSFSCFSFKAEIPEMNTLPGSKIIYAGNPESINKRRGIIDAVSSCLNAFCPPELLTHSRAFTVRDSFDGIHILENLLYGTACHYLSGEAKTSPEQEHERLLKEISKYIFLHNGKPVTVSEIARYLHYSPGYLRLLVRSCSGLSTKAFIDMERIKIMKELLLYSDIRIGELASLMEFHDVKYFSRFFRKYTGVTPRTWLHQKRYGTKTPR